MRRYASAALTARELERSGRTALLLSGELDLATAPILEAAIVRVSAKRARGLTLDLSELTFMDASGLHVIVYVNQLYKRLGYGFSLIPGSEAVQRLFQITGVIDELPFVLSCPTIDV
jgi:anti-sigma B factor antagonist